MEEVTANRPETPSMRVKYLYGKSIWYQGTDPEATLWLARKTSEAICRQLFIDTISPNPGNLMLDKMIEKLSSKVLPKHIQVALRSIQHYGNLGAHEQGCDETLVTPHYVTACLASLESFVTWYFREYLSEEDFDPKQVVQSINNQKHPLTNLVIGSLETTLPSSSASLDNSTASSAIRVERISEFWKTVSPKTSDGTRVAIDGTLSQYAPLLVGDPRTKRELHLEFRKALSHKLSRKQEADINTMLAYTAGQMVLRFHEACNEWFYLGLYHSIVRNSIPVFVAKDYYRDFVARIFSQYDQPTFDAHVEGHIRVAPSSIKKQLFQKNQTDRLISPRLLEDSKRPIHCIFVDGNDSLISVLGPAKYLDGDIWLAIEANGEEFFRSRFCDLADKNDVESQAKALSEEIRSEFGSTGYRVLMQFDDQAGLLPYESSELSYIRSMLFT